MLNSKFANGLFGASIAFMVLTAFLIPVHEGQTQPPDTSRPASPRQPQPALDTLAVPPVVERVAEKTERMLQGAKKVNLNSQNNEKSARKIQRKLQKAEVILKENETEQQAAADEERARQSQDTVTPAVTVAATVSEPMPAKRNFLQRLADRFRRR